MVANQSVVTVAVLYLNVEVIVVLCFGVLFTISSTWYLAIEVVVLLAFVVLGLVMHIGRKTIVEIGEDTRKKVVSRNQLTLTAEQLVKKPVICRLRRWEMFPARIEKLAEMIRYSDPMSPESLYDLDASIDRELSMLGSDLSEAADSSSRCGRAFVCENRYSGKSD